VGHAAGEVRERLVALTLDELLLEPPAFGHVADEREHGDRDVLGPPDRSGEDPQVELVIAVAEADGTGAAGGAGAAGVVGAGTGSGAVVLGSVVVESVVDVVESVDAAAAGSPLSATTRPPRLPAA